jgi:hypothetical protein
MMRSTNIARGHLPTWRAAAVPMPELGMSASCDTLIRKLRHAGPARRIPSAASKLPPHLLAATLLPSQLATGELVRDREGRGMNRRN